MRKSPAFALLSLVLVLILTTLIVVPAQAQPPAGQPAISARAVLRNSTTGKRVELPVKVRTRVLDRAHRDVTYTAEVPGSLLWLDFSDQKQDSSISVRVTLHMYYDDTWSGDTRYTAVDHYTGVYDLLDYQVGWRNAYVNAMCAGNFLDSGYCSNSERLSVGVPTSGQSYTLTPSWHGRYVDTSGVRYQEGYIFADLYRGSTTWNLGLCIARGGTGAIAGCTIG